MPDFTPVARQLVILDEAFAADIATISLLASVIAHVRSQCRVLAEREIANVATVWAFAGVRPETSSKLSETQISHHLAIPRLTSCE